MKGLVKAISITVLLVAMLASCGKDKEIGRASCRERVYVLV